MRVSRMAGGYLLAALATLTVASIGAGLRAAEPADGFDSAGRLRRLWTGAAWVEAVTDVAVPSPDWQQVAYLGDSARLTPAAASEPRVWQALLAPSGTVGCVVSQQVRRSGHRQTIEVTARADASNAVAGVFLLLHVPAALFAGGSYTLDGVRGALPERRVTSHALTSGPARQVQLAPPGAPYTVVLGLPAPLTVQVQDSRQWSDHFTVVVTLWSGPLAAGSSVRRSISLEALAARQVPVVDVRVAPGETLYRFDGFGGNYCYALDTPVAAMTRDALSPPWARIRVRLEALVPPASAAGAYDEFRRQLAAADRANLPFAQDLDFARTLSHRGARLMAGMWQPPDWMLESPVVEAQNRLTARASDLLPPAVSAFLAHARDSRGLNVELFACNEPDWGAAVVWSAQEYVELVRGLGRAFRLNGVATRMLLGDLARAEGTLDYLQPVLSDPEALSYCAALSFHSWGGAPRETYEAWSELAGRLRLPLIVAEAGVEPDWRNVQVHSPEYALSELWHYQQLLAWAHPQVVLLWEYSDNYAILARGADNRWQTTPRFAFQQHWLAFTPPGSLAWEAQASGTQVLPTCFAVPQAAGRPGLTLHLANQFGEQPVRVVGLPAELTSLRVVETTPGRLFARRSDLPVTDGRVQLTLAGASLTTLTTLPIPECSADGLRGLPSWLPIGSTTPGATGSAGAVPPPRRSRTGNPHPRHRRFPRCSSRRSAGRTRSPARLRSCRGRDPVPG